jgi:hypothetical protein
MTAICQHDAVTWGFDHLKLSGYGKQVTSRSNTQKFYTVASRCSSVFCVTDTIQTASSLHYSKRLVFKWESLLFTVRYKPYFYVLPYRWIARPKWKMFSYVITNSEKNFTRILLGPEGVKFDNGKQSDAAVECNYFLYTVMSSTNNSTSRSSWDLW